MLEFAYPVAFLIAPLPLLVWWLMPPHRERMGAMRVPFFHDLVDAADAEARAGAVVLNRRVIHKIVMTLIWLLLVTGLTKPQWVGAPIVRTEAARDIMLAIDLSGSMDYPDFPGEDGAKVRRLTAVQRVVDQFIAARASDRVGLIVFGTRAYLQLPFTRDLDTARALVGLMDVGMAGPQTALGDGIGLAIRAFESSEVEQRLLILLTDGNDTASDMTPINAAEIARLNGVEIYTIGVGNPEASGEDRVDFTTLEAIAERTGGKFFTAENTSVLAEVYARIDALAPGEVTTQSWRPRESLVHVPVIVALLLALLAYVFLLGPKLTRLRRA
ncbi:MAG: VWA domain-containing protein [Gammaproteobacteria bacterium]|nr:VWA domain-containing protein [Gammaproteobacteria bacterium]